MSNQSQSRKVDAPQRVSVPVRKTYSPDGSDSLAALADALGSEPRSDLDEAIEIASGHSLLMAEKRHLVALYDALTRSFKESLPVMRKARLALQNECLEYAEVSRAQ